MKILVIDDSQAMRKIIEWAIRQSSLEVGEVLEASSYQDAMQQVESKYPDIVIADWNMPNLGGLELLSALRKINNFVKFGFFVNQTSANILNLASSIGADFIISNPSSNNTLETQMNQTIKNQLENFLRS